MSDTTEFRLPQLADAVTSVKLSLWLKQEGDRVEAGEPIAEVETDKTTVELEAPASGVVQTLRVPAGTNGLETGTLLAVIASHPGGEAASRAAGPDGGARAAPPTVSDAMAAPATATRAADQTAAAAVHEPAATAPAVVATPLARKMAAASGIELSTIRGTGLGGRIGKGDIDRVLLLRRGGPPAEDGSPPAPASGIAAHDKGSFNDRKLTAMRRVTAARMQQAKQTVPHFYLRVDCTVDAALDLLAAARRQDATAPTLTDVVIRTAAYALERIPLANAAWADGAVRIYDNIDIAIAVNTPAGLITPIIRNAGAKALGEIAAETRALIARAREGTLQPADYTGGTFTISNLGMYGVDSLYAIVNPPQSCILGVGAARARPVAIGQEVRVAQVMACTLSADHRVIDGAVGADFLAAIKDCLEQPGLMML